MNVIDHVRDMAAAGLHSNVRLLSSLLLTMSNNNPWVEAGSGLGLWRKRRRFGSGDCGGLGTGGKERMRALGWGSEVSKGLVGRNTLRNASWVLRVPALCRALGRAPCGRCGEPLLEELKAEALRMTLAKISRKLGVEGSLSHCRRSERQLPLWADSSLAEERFLSRPGSKKPCPLASD